MQCEYECEFDSSENVFYYYIIIWNRVKYKVESEVKLVQLWWECVLIRNYVI